MGNQPLRPIIKEIIQELLNEGNELQKSIDFQENVASDIIISEWPNYKAWVTSVMNYLSTVLDPDNSYLKSLKRTLTGFESTAADILNANAILKKLIVDIDRGIFEKSEPAVDALNSLLIIFNRFDQVVKQLRRRHGGRPSLDIGDEYDVQDLLYALLRLYFDDIEPEEYVPKFAGKGSRCDFALRDHNIIVEAKKTRNSLKDKEIGEELTLDTAKYAKYPKVKHLVCFVYDPDGYIRNVKGLENDLGGLKNGLNVHIFIRPK